MYTQCTSPGDGQTLYEVWLTYIHIQSATAENRRGKKERGQKEETTAVKYNVRICYAGGRKEERKKKDRNHNGKI